MQCGPAEVSGSLQEADARDGGSRVVVDHGEVVGKGGILVGLRGALQQ